MLFISLIRKLYQQNIGDPKVKSKLKKQIEGKQYIAEMSDIHVIYQFFIRTLKNGNLFVYLHQFNGFPC